MPSFCYQYIEKMSSMSILHDIVQSIILTASVFLDVYMQSFTIIKAQKMIGYRCSLLHHTPYYVDQQYKLHVKPVHSGAFQQYVTNSIGIYEHQTCSRNCLLHIGFICHKNKFSDLINKVI